MASGPWERLEGLLEPLSMIFAMPILIVMGFIRIIWYAVKK
jgi:hypothetical protein